MKKAIIIEQLDRCSNKRLEKIGFILYEQEYQSNKEHVLIHVPPLYPIENNKLWGWTMVAERKNIKLIGRWLNWMWYAN